jgi:hypothetical protein
MTKPYFNVCLQNLGGNMDLWLDLLFGNAVGLSSMIVIFAAFGLMLFYGGFIIYKVANDKSPH